MRIAVVLLLVFTTASASAVPVRHLSGIPFVFEHRWGTDEAGTDYSHWTGLFGLWHSERTVSPDGEVGTRWWVIPFASHTVNIGGMREWSILWPVPILQHTTWTESGREQWIAAFWLWKWRQDAPGHMEWRLIPFFGRERHPNGAHEWGAVPPLDLVNFTHWVGENGATRDTLGSWTGFLFQHMRAVNASDEVEVKAHVFPLYHRRWTSEGAWRFLAPSIPLVWFERDPEEGSRQDYVFPWLRHRMDDPDSANERQTDGILPLWVRSHRVRGDDEFHWRWLFPHFRSRESLDGGTARNAADVVFPWYHNHSERLQGDGSWEREDSHTGVIPLVWGREHGELSYMHLLPLIYWWEGENFVGFPFVWRGANHFLILPLYGRWEPGNSRHTLFLFPLWYRHSVWAEKGAMPTAQRSRVLWPLIGWGFDGNDRHVWAIPFWYQTIDQRGSQTRQVNRGIPALLWFSGRGTIDGVRNESFDTFCPLYWRWRDWVDGEELDSAADVVFPLWWHFRDYQGGEIRERAHVIFPLWWDFYDQPEKRRRRGLFPLWFSDRVEGELRGLSLLWPVVHMDWNREATAHSDTPAFDLDFLGFLGGVESWANGDLIVSLLGGPLWIRDVEPESIRRELLGGLWGYERTPDRRRMRLLWIPIPLP